MLSLSKNLVEFRRRSGERKPNYFLRRHVRRRKYFSACKRASCPSPRTASAMQSGSPPLCQKSNTFLTVSARPRHPAGSCCCRKRAVAQRARACYNRYTAHTADIRHTEAGHMYYSQLVKTACSILFQAHRDDLTRAATLTCSTRFISPRRWTTKHRHARRCCTT